MEAKNILIERNLRLVAHVVKKYQGTDVELDDLISIGTIGLMKAISTFDSTKTARLSTYAGKCINNELLMLFRSRKKHSREISLYEPIGTDKEGNEISLLDVMEGPAVDVVEEYSTREDIRHVLDSMKSVLSSKEYEVICCRFGLFGQKEQTQREIASHLHISRSYAESKKRQAPSQNTSEFYRSFTCTSNALRDAQKSCIRMISRRNSRVFCELCSQKTPRGTLPVNSNDYFLNCSQTYASLRRRIS